MTTGYVNHKGDQIDPLDPAKQVPPEKRSAQTDEQRRAGHHKGWRVLGYAPGVIDAAKVAHIKRREEVIRANIGAVKPEPDPGLWSVTVWKQHHKPKAVRSKPYEIQSAAVECMRLAERAGWCDVHLVEVKKEPVKNPE